MGQLGGTINERHLYLPSVSFVPVAPFRWWWCMTVNHPKIASNMVPPTYWYAQMASSQVFDR